MKYIKFVLFRIRFIFQEDLMGPNILLKKIKRIPSITKAAGNLPVLLSYDFSSKFWSIKILWTLNIKNVKLHKSWNWYFELKMEALHILKINK